MGDVLLGAILALIGTLLVQFFAMPVADARRRRDEQWFRDVRSMLELIGGEIRPQLRSVQSADAIRSLRVDPDYDATDPRMALMLEEIEGQYRERSAALIRLLTRGTWLSNRILMIDEFNHDLMRADTEWDMARTLLQTEAYRPESEVLPAEQQSEQWRKGEGRLDEAERLLLEFARRARPPHARRRISIRRK